MWKFHSIAKELRTLWWEDFIYLKKERIFVVRLELGRYCGLTSEEFAFLVMLSKRHTGFVINSIVSD